MKTSIVVKYPLPRIVCDHCRKLCVYKKYDNDSDDESWLECTGCGQRWDDIGYAVKRQDEMLDGITNTIRDLALQANEQRDIVSWLKSVWIKIWQSIGKNKGGEQ